MSDGDIHIYGAPTGRRLEQGPSQPKGYVGRPGGDGLEASLDRLKIARKYWTEGRPKDFERTGKRTWRDRATGVDYHRQHGNPLFGGPPEDAKISCFLVVNGELIFLEPSGQVQVTKVVELGAVAGRAAGDRERF